MVLLSIFVVNKVLYFTDLKLKTVFEVNLDYIYIHIYTLSLGLSTLVKELATATRVMQRSSYKLITLVSDKAKCKQTKATT